MLLPCFACAIIVLACGMLLRSERLEMLSLAAFFAPLVILHFYREYNAERRKKQLEGEIPDVLLLACSFPENSSVIRIADFVAGHSQGPIAQEFSLAARQIRSGMPVEKAVEKIKLRNKSAGLDRAINLILGSLRSGGDMRETFRQAADDFIETNSIAQERNASAAVQKYTLLAGCLLVPLILGMVSSIGTGPDSAAFNELGIGMNEGQKTELRSAALLGNEIYILEYVILASVFVSLLEGIPKKAVVYIACLLPVAYAVYFIAGKF